MTSLKEVYTVHVNLDLNNIFIYCWLQSVSVRANQVVI